jgi:hypothetical protein
VAECSCWYNIIVLNAHALSKIKSYDTKKNFCHKLRNVFSQFLEYHTKLLLADLNSKLWREDIFKPKLWQWGLYETCSDSGVKSGDFPCRKM